MHDTLHTSAQLAGRLPGLLLEASKVAHSFMKGVHGRRRVGTGETFWQFRPWVPGDSRRDIDWKQTAKRDDTVIRQMEWEAAQTLWLWRDGSASMDFSSARNLPKKALYAEVLLLALALLALEGGEQAALIGGEMGPQSHPSSIGRIAMGLAEQSALTEGARPVSARSHAVLFSDFYFSPAETAAFCAALAQREVRGLIVQLVDPVEKALSFNGRVKFRDAENGAATLTIQQVESVAAEYEARFRAHRDAVAAAAESCGWKFLAVDTDTPYEKALGEIYALLAVKPK